MSNTQAPLVLPDFTTFALLGTAGRVMASMAPINTVRAQQGGAPNASVTGTLVETVLATYTMPALTLRAGDMLEGYMSWAFIGTAALKTPRIRFGGVSGTIYHGSNVGSTNVAFSAMVGIVNNVGATTQRGLGAATAVFPWAASTVGLPSSSLDTTTGTIDVVITGQLSNAADTMTLSHYNFRIIPGV